MNNAETIQHNGKDILIIDIANITPIEVIKRIKAVEEKIIEFPSGSVYLLVLTANLTYNSITSSNLNEFSELYGKYLKVVVVVDESQNLPDGTSITAPNGMQIFSDKNAALDWLSTK